MIKKIVIFIFSIILIPKPIELYPMTAELDHNNNNVDSLSKLWITFTANNRYIEISWINARIQPGDLILLTDGESDKFTLSNNNNLTWTSNRNIVNVVESIQPKKPDDCITTKVQFNMKLSDEVNIKTSCYAYWVNYVNSNGDILSTGCIRAYPTWMNDMKSKINQTKIRDLMIPGTHDSGAFRVNFDPEKHINKINLVTKYSLTQDDSIYSQLMHGIRFLDIRVGYFALTKLKFYVTHGFTKQISLISAINDVKRFVEETNEIVIFDVHEFTRGFDKNDLNRHYQLVQYLNESFGNILVDPSLKWNTKLTNVWEKKQNVFLSYENPAIVSKYPSILFQSVEHRWGDKTDWNSLKKYLQDKHKNSYLSDRPVSDMAELTPDYWGTILDKYGGLRKMADSISYEITKLYREELKETSNIVAVDFYRGTSMIDLSIYYNNKKNSKNY